MDLSEIDALWKPPKDDVELCLDSDLVLQIEKLEQRWRAAIDRDAQRVRASDPSEAEPLEEQILELRERAAKATVTFVFRSLGRLAYSELLAAHPPTQEQADEGARWAITFPPALMAASCEEPAGTTLGWWQERFDLWSTGQVQRVWGACLAANAGVAEVPKDLIGLVETSAAGRRSKRRAPGRGRSS